MAWIESCVRLPRHGQKVVIYHCKDFFAGEFDGKHPFSPCIIDRKAGKFYSNFSHWKPLSAPKVKP